MHRFILIPFVFFPVFAVVMVVNQLSYGGCFKGYCIEAALPKVIFITAIIAAVIVFNIPDRNRERNQNSLGQSDNHSNTSAHQSIVSDSEIISNNRGVRNGAKAKNSEPTSSYNQLEFGRFEDAARASKTLAKTHGISIRQFRRGDKYYIEFPAGLKSINIDSLMPDLKKESLPDLKRVDFVKVERDHNYQDLDDYGYEEPEVDLHFELFDDADAYARSNEDGWFYSDTDPGWENNVPDGDRDA